MCIDIAEKLHTFEITQSESIPRECNLNGLLTGKIRSDSNAKGILQPPQLTNKADNSETPTKKY